MSTLSPLGLYALAAHEGLVPAPYLDSVRVWTYGIGHTKAAGPPDPSGLPRGMPTAAALDRAIEAVITLYLHDAARYAKDVARAVKVPLAPHQFDALVSFHYNTGAIQRASLTRRLNAGDVAGAAEGFKQWTKPPEVLSRRLAEYRLFRHGEYPTHAVPVWSVSPSGRLVWRAVRQLSRDDFLTLVERVKKKQEVAG